MSPGTTLTTAAARIAPPVVAIARPTFDEVYEEHFDFVFRSARRLGVPAANIDDAVQDVFLVVYRRLGDFEGRASMRTWLFGIAMRVAQDHRRRAKRKATHGPLGEDVVDAAPGPETTAAGLEAVQIFHQLLERLDEDRRAVFVLADIEGMTAPEVAQELGIAVRTVYTRLEAARRMFEEVVERFRRRLP
jgi:RNA polymerase sigma-70 factor (ECF subfamily)